MSFTFEMAMAWDALGFTPPAIRALHAVQGFEARTAHLEGMKQEAKRLYRQRALVHHPDRGGDGRIFGWLAQAYAEIEKCKIVRMPPPPQVRIIVVEQRFGYQGYRGGSSGVSSTTASAGSGSVYRSW